MPYVARSKDAKKKLQGMPDPPGVRTVTLACGHETSAGPTTSNPDRWYCCGAFQKKVAGRTPRAPMVGNSKKAHHRA